MSQVPQEMLREVTDLLLGGGGDELFDKMQSGVSKMNPTQSDLATKDKRKRQITAGLSAVGATAGAAGLALGGHNLSRSYKLARYGAKGGKAAMSAKHAAISAKPTMTRRAAIKHAVGEERLATGLIPLEVAGLTGEVAATRILHGDTKKKPKGTTVKKDLGELLNNVRAPSKTQLTLATVSDPKKRKKGLEYTRKTAGALRKLPNKVTTTNEVEKAAEIDVLWEGTFAKADADKQQIFGWASVVEVDGEPVVDLQGDYISADEMEKAAYSYVTKSRKGGDMHLRDDWSPVQKSEMIESFVITEDKRDAMGLPDTIPTGWWVGFKVADPDVWTKIKSGERTGFSIHGRGKRTPV